MHLYHGTAPRFLPKILEVGLQPRGRKKGNWDHSIKSREDMVYLTTAYSMHYAVSSLKRGEQNGLILEIDHSKLDQSKLHPDEDFLEQATRKHESYAVMRGGFKDPMKGMTEYFRDNLHLFADNWELSIKHLGNCCYQGTVPVDAISRYAIVPIKTIIRFSDPTITLMNFRVMGGYYEALSNCIFGHEIDEGMKESSFMRNLPTKEDLEAIEVHDLRNVETA